MASRDEILKLLFPSGIPVEKLGQLDEIIKNAQSLADLAGAPVPARDPAPAPARKRGGFSPEARLASIDAKKASKHERIKDAIEFVLKPGVRYHSLNWLRMKFHTTSNAILDGLLSAIERGVLELRDPDGNVLNTAEHVKGRQFKARAILVEAAPALPAQRTLDVETVIKVDDSTVEKVLQFIQTGDKTAADVSRHFHYGSGFVRQILSDAHRRYGFVINRDASDVLTIASAPKAAQG